MSTTQEQLDTSLGTLAATAMQTGCPEQPVQRMCELSEFTRGLDTVALAGAAELAVEGSASASVDLGALVAEASDVVQGVGGGLPARELHEVGEALAVHDGQWASAMGSLGSCAGALDRITAGCVGEVGALVEEVCSLAVTAVDSGAREVAGQVVQGAVTAVSGILEQRNRGLEMIVDLTVADCAPAAGDLVEPPCQDLPEPVVPQAECPDPGPEPDPECEVQVEEAPESEPAPDPESEGESQPEATVDPVHGFDKEDRGPGSDMDSAAGPDEPPSVVPASVADTDSDPVVTDSADTPPAADGWNPDIWITAQVDASASLQTSGVW